MTNQPKNAKDMTPQEYAAAKREVSLNARRAAREPKPTSFSRRDRNLQETPSEFGDSSAHDLTPDEFQTIKRKFSQLDRVTEGRASQARTISRIRSRQDSRSQK
jgi:hypothetical protein